MTASDEKYEERRRLEAENALLRVRRENERLKSDEHANTILVGIAGLFTGEYHLYASPESGGWYIQFRKS